MPDLFGFTTNSTTTPPAGREGVVTRAPADVDGQLFVKIPEFSPDHEYGPCVWQPKGIALPQEGARVIVIFDNDNEPWVPIWEGEAVIPDDLITLDRLASVQDWLVPTGSVFATGCATAPSGYLICDGSPVARLTYPALFAALGGTSSPYGLPADTTMFYLPDLRGRTPIGVGSATGASGATNHALGEQMGDEKYKLQAAESGTNGNGSTDNDGAHNHLIQGNQFNPTDAGGGLSSIRMVPNSPPDSSFVWSVDDWRSTHTHSLAPRDADTAHQNMQPSLTLNYIIKI